MPSRRSIHLPLPPPGQARRRVITGLGASGSLLLLAGSWRARASALPVNPFTLGVASGYPGADGIVLWTRLAPQPLAPDGGMPPATVPVRWELASDERMRNIVQSGTSYATPDWAHSVHVEPAGLSPSRPYWYRFRSGDAYSAIGRFCTTPPAGTALAQLRLAIACCQNYEHGYYLAYRQMLQDELDLIVHVGDYIYENSGAEHPVRSHGAGECYTLDDYRIRHALYRGDPDLQAAHAACAWLFTWDDHEVGNDYAGDVSEQDDPPELFRARRAAAYRAYYEHLPLPRRAAPFGADLRLFASRSYGDLADIHLLDERQYRSPQACPLPGQHGSSHAEHCAELGEEQRTMLGGLQEAWLGARLARSRARWNLLAQGVVMAQMNEAPAPAERYWTDAWSGYPAARARLLHTLATTRAANPVVLSGDIHAFVAADLNLQAAELDSPVIASELVTTSISSRPPDEAMFKALLQLNPNLRFATGRQRGYLRLELNAERMHADLIGIDTVAERSSGARCMKSFEIAAGRPGLISG